MRIRDGPGDPERMRMFLLGPEADLVFSASDFVRAAGCPCASPCVLDEKSGRFVRRCRRGAPVVLP